jgi:hypothetical protein
MALDGTVTNQFTIPTPNSHPAGITVGPDGAIWFTELGAGKIGRLQLDAGGAGGGGGGIVDKVAPSFTRGASFSNKRFRVQPARHRSARARYRRARRSASPCPSRLRRAS